MKLDFKMKIYAILYDTTNEMNQQQNLFKIIGQNAWRLHHIKSGFLQNWNKISSCLPKYLGMVMNIWSTSQGIKVIAEKNKPWAWSWTHDLHHKALRSLPK